MTNWTPKDFLHLALLLVFLFGIILAIWYGQSGDWKNRPSLTAYIQKTIPGSYFVRDGDCQVAMDSGGAPTGIAVCGRSVEAIVTHTNEKLVGEIVTDLSGRNAWKQIGPVFSAFLPYGNWQNTWIENGTDITVKYSAATEEYLLVDTR